MQRAIQLCDAHANDNVTIGETCLRKHAARLNRVNREDLSLTVAAPNVRRAVCESQVGGECAPYMELIIASLHCDEDRDGDERGNSPADNLDGTSCGHACEAA